MAIAVTADAVTYKQTNGARVSVRTSAGIPYVVAHDVDSDDIVMLKGNATTPTSFSEVDAGNSNVSSGVYGGMSAAISSDNVIHVVFMEDDGKTSACRYVTFSTSTDTWGTSVDVDAGLGSDPGSLTPLYSAIAIDANDIPHIVYTRYDGDMGIDYQALYYNNRIGGAWNASGTAIVAATANRDIVNFDLAIDADNLPVVSYHDDGTADRDIWAATGTANDASSFTLQVIDSNPTGSTLFTSIAIDSSGNHHVAYTYVASTTYRLYIVKHNYGNAWSTWQTPELLDSFTNIPNGINVALVIDGTDRYVFAEDPDDNDIKYYTDSSGSWVGPTTLETGTYNTAKAKWAFWVDNDSGGVIMWDYYPVSNQSGSFPLASTTNTGAAQSFTGNGDDIKNLAVYLKKTGSPTGNAVAKIYAHSGTFGTSSIPTGAALATSDNFDVSTLTTSYKLVTFKFSSPFTTTNGTNYCLAVEYSGGDGSNTVDFGLDTSSGTHAGNASRFLSGSWSVPDATYDAPFHIYKTASELDYTFADEVSGEEDIWFNSLSLGGAAATFLPKVIFYSFIISLLTIWTNIIAFMKF